MNTSALSPTLLAGFLTEARGYTASLRKLLIAPVNEKQPAEIHRQLEIVGSSMEMLGLDAVAALAMPAADRMRVIIEAGEVLAEAECGLLLAMLDEIERHFAEAGGGTAPPAPITLPPARVDLPAELLDIFAMEAQEHCDSIQAVLERLRKQPADRSALTELRRVTHTLKGASASVGFTEMARLAHLMEDLMERCLDQEQALTPHEVALLVDSADALGGLLDPSSSEQVRALVASMEARYLHALGQSSEAPSEPAAPVAPHEPSRRADNLLRLPQPAIDALINRVGEVVINRASQERYIALLRGLLTELELSTTRLQRVTQDIDLQIQGTAWRASESKLAGDPTFDPIELDRYSQLYQFTRELEEVSADTGDVNNRLHMLADDLDGSITRERRLTNELQDGLMATRLVTFREVEIRLRRAVQRTARDLQKSVEIVLNGLETRVDKTILDALVDPLTHLLRNAVDHGIEPPETRRSAGKPEAGTVRLNVWRERGRVNVSLADDGAGIDPERLRRRAIEMGLLAEGERADEERLHNLLFAEGFSTAKTVTQTSGRGVGLDIVRRAVNQLQGTVRVESRMGEGTTFIISVPITLAIARALFIQSGGQTFAVPVEQIAAVLRIDPTALDSVREQGMIRHEGRALSVTHLADFAAGQEAARLQAHYGLVVEQGDLQKVLLIEGLAGIHETVVKSLGSHLRRVRGVSGATIAGDGRVVLILDIFELVGAESPDTSQPLEAAATSDFEPHQRVLVVDDSLSVRRVVCAFLERAGWQTIAAKDGIEALEKLAGFRPDVALVDIEMPRMNGYELLSRIKSDPMLASTPVIFLTSRSAAKHRERATQLGVDGYLVKPYHEDELLAELDRVRQAAHAH